MTKLPVGAAINEAARFGLQRFGTVLRYLWLPMCLSAGVMGLFILTAFDIEAMRAAEAGASQVRLSELLRAPLGVVFLGGLFATIVVHFFLSGVMASIFRLVALGEERPGLFHLRFDGPAMRVFVAYLILTALIGAAGFLAFVIASAATGQSLAGAISGFGRMLEFGIQAQPGEMPPDSLVRDFESVAALIALGWFIALVPTIYLSIRLLPFPAGSAAENRLFLFGAFALTRGNFWRIVGVFALFLLFALVLSVIFQITAAILQLLGGFLVTQGAALAFVGGLLLFALGVATILLQTFLFGVQTAIPAIVYRRLKTGE